MSASQFELDESLSQSQLDARKMIIKTLNDNFRQTLIGGRIVVTQGILSLRDIDPNEVVKAVQMFDDFTEDNDPWGEHDFGSFTLKGNKIMWKIDLYDESCDYGSEDPADPEKTTRVLTLLTPSEY